MTRTRTWLITGASGGLGAALVHAVLAGGDRVVATTRGASLPFEHPNLEVLQTDLAGAVACRDAVADAVGITGRLDVVINNAGHGLVGAIEEVTEEQARAIIEVDMFAPLWISQAAVPHMRAAGGGEIVQISSVGAVGAMAFFGLYNAAKWGLEGFSEALAAEVDPMGIRVTLAEIGAMDTRWATAGMRFARPQREYDELRAATLGTTEVPWPYEPGATGGGTAPEAVAREIVDHLAEPGTAPLRLVLGADAADQISGVLDRRWADYAGQRVFRELRGE